MAALPNGSSRRPWTPPDHWDDVAKIGDLIPMGFQPDTRAKLVAARVPLDPKYAMSDVEQWTPLHLLEACQARNLTVHMVIDLTNTFKYYDGVAEFTSRGVEYVKLKVEGFADVPTEDIVQRFIHVLSTWEDTFRQQPPNQGDLTPVVVVHCTHGLNRTGYLIARYLIATKGVTVKEALATFTAARPPGLIKHIYVQTLYDMFDQSDDAVLPELPLWAKNKYDRTKLALQAVNNMPPRLLPPSTPAAKPKWRRSDQSHLRRPPENWTDPPRFGAVVADSPFLPMRTLLDDTYHHGAERWTPATFVAELGHVVRLVVDLTNTTKYYDGPSAFPSTISYRKFALEGFSAAPSPTSVAAFLDLVDAFERDHPGKHLALHCTHGLNRTGYLVASYLIRRKQYSVQAALDAFAAARPPGLIKFLYIDALHDLHGCSADVVTYPTLPPWASKKYAKQTNRRVPRLWPPPSFWTSMSPHGAWIPLQDSTDSVENADEADKGSRRDAADAPPDTAAVSVISSPVQVDVAASSSSLPPRRRRRRMMHLLPMKAMLDERYESDGSWTTASFASVVADSSVHGIVSLDERDAYYPDAELPPTLRRAYVPVRSGQVPPQSDVDAFDRTLRTWQAEVGDDTELRVAIHCSAGGRTGFFVLHALVHFAKKSVDEAKAIYETAWPPGVVPKNLLKNLYHLERQSNRALPPPSAERRRCRSRSRDDSERRAYSSRRSHDQTVSQNRFEGQYNPQWRPPSTYGNRWGDGRADQWSQQPIQYPHHEPQYPHHPYYQPQYPHHPYHHHQSPECQPEYYAYNQSTGSTDSYGRAERGSTPRRNGSRSPV
ncbi:hypothetical protein DYB35_003131 [Aphanomyces astaci]|uniref:Tyrosine specific protein phosphatases domain-containing protein n=1 Tax=Aphanomyces astaci TaxID=112090 RepID=A0A418D8P4_APHAT|nr:hypothetical protein DYB35_003131 [Aphanomyces astaci]